MSTIRELLKIYFIHSLVSHLTINQITRSQMQGASSGFETKLDLRGKFRIWNKAWFI